MGCHRNFWAIVKYIFEIHGSIFKPNKIWKSHLPFQQYMNKEPRFQISAKSDNVWRKYITFSGSRSWIYLEVAVHYTAAPRWRDISTKFLSMDTIPFTSSNIGKERCKRLKLRCQHSKQLSLHDKDTFWAVLSSWNKNKCTDVRGVHDDKSCTAVCSVYRPYLCIKSVRRHGETRTISPSAWSTLWWKNSGSFLTE